VCQHFSLWILEPLRPLRLCAFAFQPGAPGGRTSPLVANNSPLDTRGTSCRRIAAGESSQKTQTLSFRVTDDHGFQGNAVIIGVARSNENIPVRLLPYSRPFVYSRSKLPLGSLTIYGSRLKPKESRGRAKVIFGNLL